MNSKLGIVVLQRRDTPRKRHLREVLDSMYLGRPALLDELRWIVVGKQLAEALDESARRSIRNSFARTVREQLDDHVTQKVPVTPETPVGLIARAAVYRVSDLDFLPRFLNAQEACILCRYKTNFDVDETRYVPSRYVIPHHHAATFRFFESRPAGITYEQLWSVPGVFIPTTQKLTLIVPEGATADLASVAVVPWQLFGYEELSAWSKVNGMDPLHRVHRNSYP